MGPPNPTDDAIAELVAELEQNSSVTASVELAIDRMLSRIEGSIDDPDQIRAAITAFRSNRERLAAAAARVPE